MNAKIVAQTLASVLLAAAAGTLLAQNDPGSTLTEKDIAAPTTLSAISPSPDRPAEMPPKPPTITCSGGQLTVLADNSTLGSILTAVQPCIDVRFDVPADSREERTFVHLGPGPTRAVLRSLLESTGDDFVIEPSATNPEAIRSVILFARARTDEQGEPATGNMPLTPARRAWLEERRMTRTPATSADESRDPSADLSSDSQSVADTPVAEIPASSPPVGTDNAGATPSASAPEPAGSPAPGPAPAPETSNNGNSTDVNGQLQGQITSMQQLFQQRAQMIQGQAKPQSPATPPSPQ